MKDNEVFSIFDKKMYLNLESVIITELIINKKKNLYLEKRDFYGRHEIIKYDYENNSYI